MGEIINQPPTAPKKTWGGHWFPQGMFSVDTFGLGGLVITPKSPTFLSCGPLLAILKTTVLKEKVRTFADTKI